MTNSKRILAAALVCAVSIPSLTNVASAMPIGNALALKNAAPAAVETVQWRRGWYGGGWRRGGGGWGWGAAGAGLVAGAIIGSALTAPYYGYGPYYAPPPVAYGPPVGAPVAGDATAYCMQRFRSYDPASGTYLGYDGLRHPCP